MNKVPFSVFGVPLLGLLGLMICLWHPQLSLQAESRGAQTIFLVDPSPQLDKSMTIFLRQEARNVAHSRAHETQEAQARTVADYNLIAQECTPAVFRETHLPPSLAF